MQIDLFSAEKFKNKVLQKTKKLQEINSIIQWENFRQKLELIWGKENNGLGRPSFDAVKMFKVLVLQKLSGNLSDEQMELQINDRISFQEFLGIVNAKQAPDEKTIWLYRDKLSKTQINRKPAFDELFDDLLLQIASLGYEIKEGNTKIIDAQIVEVPIRRDKRGEKEIIEKGEIPDDWNENKKKQKDTDADWKKKGDKTFFGYENHARVDSKSKLIEDYTITPVSVHDSKETFNLVSREDEGKELYGDSAYRSEETEGKLAKMSIKSEIHEKGYKNRPLTEFQKETNRQKSKVRARVEHAFASLEESCGSFIRSIGLEKAKLQIGLNNFVHNLRRIEFLFRSGFFKQKRESKGF
jgi:IS5 family transposase